jgi:hypothetical protein
MKSCLEPMMGNGTSMQVPVDGQFGRLVRKHHVQVLGAHEIQQEKAEANEGARGACTLHH